MNGAPIALSGVSPLPCLPFRDATSLQVLEACPHTFPTFPDTHAYSTAQPFVSFFKKVAHLGKPKVVHPPSDCIGQFLLALLVAPAVTTLCQLLEFGAQFGFGFRMNAQASLSSSHVERVAEELLSVDTAYVGLLSVYFEEEFSLYELRNAFAHPFGGSRTFTEDDAVIGIAHKRKPASFKFAVKLRQHYVAQHGAERAALRNSPSRVLILVADYHTCVEILMYQRYDPAVLDCLAKYLYQLAVVDCVKEFFKV